MGTCISKIDVYEHEEPSCISHRSRRHGVQLAFGRCRLCSLLKARVGLLQRLVLKAAQIEKPLQGKEREETYSYNQAAGQRLQLAK